VARQELGKFPFKGHPGRRLCREERQLVDQCGQESPFLFIVHIHTPERIGDGIITIVCLLRERPFTQVKDGTSQGEVLVDEVIHVGSHHPLGLDVEHFIALHGDVDGRS